MLKYSRVLQNAQEKLTNVNGFSTEFQIVLKCFFIDCWKPNSNSNQ